MIWPKVKDLTDNETRKTSDLTNYIYIYMKPIHDMFYDGPHGQTSTLLRKEQTLLQWSSNHTLTGHPQASTVATFWLWVVIALTGGDAFRPSN